VKKFLWISLVVVLVGGLIFGGCEAAPAGETEVRLGTSAPMTGMFGGFGEGNIFGMKAAVEDINKLGGLDVGGVKLPVRLIVVDSESDPTKAGTLAEDLCVRDKIHAMVTADCPVTVHHPVSSACEKYKVPNIIGGGPFEPWDGYRMSLEKPWEYTWLSGFRIVTDSPAGDFRHGHPGYSIKDTWFAMLDRYADQTNKVAGVFASDDPDGVGWYGLFPGALKDYGLTVVGIDKKLGLFPMGTTDFTPIIKEWKDANVEILWGNCPAPDWGTLWRQCSQQGFKPKIATVGRAPLFYVDAASWGGDLPWGVGVEVWWSEDLPADQCPGIGDTTPKSLAKRWGEATGQPLNPGIGHGYLAVQIMLDAISRAGSLDADAINTAIAETDMLTINSRVKFIKEQQFSGIPLYVGQWVKTDTPHVWELPIVFSEFENIPTSAEPIFPLP